ncbi:MAG: FMN-binding protein [Faecalibacterium sp.]
MNKKRCHTLLPLVQLLPTVATAAAVLFALPRTVPVLAAVPERLAAVVEQPVEAASSEVEEETLPKLPYADGVYVGSSRGYGGAVRVQVTMENGSITEVEILDASHETKQFLRRAKRLLTTVAETQSWEVDAVSEATYTSRGILGAVQNALTGEVVNNPLPPQPKPAAPLVVEEFTAPSIYLDGIYTAEAMGFEGQITVQVTVAEDKITDITILSAEDEEEYLSRAKQVIPAILEGQSPNVDTVSGATYSSTGILNAVKLALAKAAVAPAEETAPEQTASEETAEETAPSEAAESGETPVTAPTVEVVQPEERAPFLRGSRKYGSSFSRQMHRHPLNRNRHLLRKCCRHPSWHCRRKRPGLNPKRKEQQNEIQKFSPPGGEPAANFGGTVAIPAGGADPGGSGKPAQAGNCRS